MILYLFADDHMVPVEAQPCYTCGTMCLHGYCTIDCEIAGEGLRVCEECETIYLDNGPCPECPTSAGEECEDTA